jgi:hypothetical protein
LKVWLVEARDRSGAVWGFLVPGNTVSAAEVAEQLRTRGRGVEISGQVVETSLLDLSTLRVRYDATRMHLESNRYTIEGGKIRREGRD